MMDEQINSTTYFACDMSSLTASEREKHIATTKEVFGAVKNVRELSDGYAFILNVKEDLLINTAKFIAKERLCCPFFNFELKTGPDEGLRLSLKGTEGIKPFIREEIGRALDDSVAQKAGFTN